MEPLVRPARPDDVPALLSMMEDFNRLEGIAWEPARTEPALRALLADGNLGLVLVLELEGPVGYGVVTFGYDLEFAGRDAFVTELYVRPQARRHKLGRRLLRELVAASEAASVRALHLLVLPENAPALALYQSEGFRPRPRQMFTRRLGEHGARVELVPVTAEHLPHIEGWLRSGAVRAFWPDTDKALDFLHHPAPGGGQLLIAHEGKPVGYLRFLPVTPEELAAAGLPALANELAGALDVDLFLADPSSRGHGLGVAALQALVARLATQYPKSPLLAAAAVHNAPAHRTLARAGFLERARFDDPSIGPSLLRVRMPGPH
jgi:ribosomal protein S18 acetylase RimI-like enzyme